MRRMWPIAVAAVVACAAYAQQVVLIKGTYAGKVGSSEARSAGTFYDTVATALRLAGVEFQTITDEDAAAGKFGQARIAVLCYSPRLAPGEPEALVNFVAQGGKLFVFYQTNRIILRALGMELVGYKGAPQRGYYYECRLAASAPAIQGLPEKFIQGSWNINALRPARDDCKVLYEWYDPDGNAIGEPAMLISDTGVALTHVLTQSDLATKGRVLLALMGHFVPEIWQRAAQAATEGVLQFSDFSSLDELAKIVQRAIDGGWANNPGPALETARSLLAQLGQAKVAQQWPQVFDIIPKLRSAAIEAYARSQKSRRCEFRAVWIHQAFGVADWGWEKSIRWLKKMGFNAILPNMLWGGVAYYNSEVLPVAESVKEKGDQVAECAKWCRRYGVELHVWKVNWNLGRSHTPDWFWEKLRREGRLQKDPKGREIGWLCPTDERNFRLERDSMLELVRKYDIAGIHFDYIRYPGMQGCYCERCRRKFEERIGHPVENWPQDVLTGPLRQEWLQFRRDNITRLVKAVAEEAHRIKPEIKVSAAVFGYWDSARDYVGQDWVLWIKNGWLDFACPMDYIPNNEQFERLVARQVEWVGGRVPLYIGIGEWRLRDAAHLAYQIRRVRELGADGFTLFHYNHPELTDVRMPLLRLGITRLDAIPPHRGKRIDFQFPPPAEGLTERHYVEGAEIEVVIKPVERWSGNAAMELRKLSGEVAGRLGFLRSGAQKRLKIKLQPGAWRICVVRSVGGRLRWETRGPIFWVLTRDQYRELVARTQPPKFEGKGIAVGVYMDGYGAEPILKTLQAAEGIEAKPVYMLNTDMLKPCQVFILPQPRRPQVLTPEAVKALRQWVRQGGRLLATHNAVGYRWCPVLIKEVATGGVDREQASTFRVEQPFAQMAALQPGKDYKHTFYDHIIVGAAKGAQVIARSGKSGRPVVVAGSFGQGKYVACGLGLGIGSGDRDVPLSEAEAKLLTALVRWLAQ